MHPLLYELKSKFMSDIQINVNEQWYTLSNVLPDTPLLWVLRDSLRLLGTKYGCGIGQCGACTIRFNGQPLRSCLLPISAVGKARITTIEGVAENNHLHAIQKAWMEMDVPQCGYCQAGQIMSAISLLENNPAPNDADIDAAMSGNLCRCATYKRIRKAIHAAAEASTPRDDKEPFYEVK
jgi:isoquinoline 1-oxidoreductase subunit alpha